MKRRRFIVDIAGLGVLSLLAPGRVLGKTNTSKGWHIEQFKDKGLAHFSYALLADKKIILVDPERDPQQYYDFAKLNNAEIIGVIETHPHADFTSSHLEIHHSCKAVIYASSLSKPSYPYSKFDEGSTIKLSDQVTIRSLYTPGHAPDHIAAVFQVDGKDVAVFSGDALLIGDVGRPDLRDYAKDVQAQRKKLAGMMYHTVHEKFAKLADDVIVYPTHGAGSLCGKAIRDANSSTIGEEKKSNYAFQIRNEAEFIQTLLSDLPFIPKYFPYDVGLNVKGAPAFQQGITGVKKLQKDFRPAVGSLIVDGRPAAVFKRSFIKNAVNIQEGGKFETWLGSVIAPDQPFYLVAATESGLTQLIQKTAKIGYELNISGAFVYDDLNGEHFNEFNTSNFDPGKNEYTIIDVRSPKEVKEEGIFKDAINIPLQDLSKRISDIPTGKPILVNCASGYRSAAGSSLIKALLPDLEVYDLGAAVTAYEKNSPQGNQH